jgi:hypothetical protein
LGFVLGGKAYIITDDYPLTFNTNNELNITDNSHIYGGTKNTSLNKNPQELANWLQQIKINLNQ